MKTDVMVILEPEITVDNEWFTSDFVRQPDGRLLAHIKYKKWSPTAKKKTVELMDSFKEPLFIFVHDSHHLKYVTALGFQPTGRFVTSTFPGKEGMLFPEAIYVHTGSEKYYLEACKEEKELILPLSSVDGYGKIEQIEEELKKREQAEWETKHYFSEGAYTRETFVPAGSVLTGYRHKHQTVSILSKGIISVLGVDKLGHATDYGVIEAPLTFVTEPGIKKIGYTHEEVVFINAFSLEGLPKEFHNIENIDKVEDFIFDKEDDKCPASLQLQ